MVANLCVGSLQEEGPYGSGRIDLFARPHSQVERCQALVILCVDVTVPSQDVVERELGSGISRPMERRALALVPRIDVEADSKKEGDGHWLVTLSSHVEHIDITRVGNERVGSLGDEVLDHEEVAEEGGEVQGREAVGALRLRVHPLLQDSLVRLIVVEGVVLELATVTEVEYVLAEDLHSSR